MAVIWLQRFKLKVVNVLDFLVIYGYNPVTGDVL